MERNETLNHLNLFLASISRLLLTHILLFSGLRSGFQAADATKTPKWPAKPRLQLNKDSSCLEKCGLSNSFFLFLLLFFIIGINLFSNNKWFSATRVSIAFFFLLSASQTLIIYLYVEYAKKSWGMLGKAKWLKIKQCRKSLCYLKGCCSTSL